MKVFMQVFAAVILATGITFGASLWVLHQEVEGFKLTISQSVTKVVNAITGFSVFGPKPKPVVVKPTKK